VNWDDTRIFLALQREGTLRSAARVVGLDQATVGRRIAAMESALGATLFLRRSDGYVLTSAGESALRSAERMEQFANELVRQAQGVDSRLEGEVKVTTTDSLALEFAIPAIARLHAAHPDVRVMLNTSTQMLNLARREADIAIRNIKPENPDLVARLLARWPIGLYASADYLARHGEPVQGAGFAGHDLAIYQPYLSGSRMPTLVGEPIHAGRIVSGVNSSLMLRAMVRAGVALGEIPVPLAERAGLLRIWPERERAGGYEVWLVTHQDLRHTARVRAMIDAVAEVFGGGGAA
jgi:DNA-binding transcriptional LysR family regulator